MGASALGQWERDKRREKGGKTSSDLKRIELGRKVVTI